MLSSLFQIGILFHTSGLFGAWAPPVHLSWYLFPVDPTPYMFMGIPVPPPIYWGGVLSLGPETWQLHSSGYVSNRIKIRGVVVYGDWSEEVEYCGFTGTVTAEGTPYSLGVWGVLSAPILLKNNEQPCFSPGKLRIGII